jgi:pyruvate/2-oxoglutarate/acetoin dehydrogenase E1 component
VIASIAAGEAFWHLDAPPAVVGVPDVPIPYAKELEQEVLPQPSHVTAVVRTMLAS